MTLDMSYGEEEEETKEEKNVEAKQKAKVIYDGIVKTEVKAIYDKEGFLLTLKGNKFPIANKPIKPGTQGFVPTGLSLIERIMEQFPEVDIWLRTTSNSISTWRTYGGKLIEFCIVKDMTPKEFAELRHTEKEQDKAIELASDHIQDLLFKKKCHQANDTINALKSFYQFHSKGRRILALDTKASLRIKSEDLRSKEKPRYAWGPPKEIRRKVAMIIPAAHDLYDRMALTFLYRTGCRRNVLKHLKIKHVQDRFKVENPVTNKKEEVLCLTIIGYNRERKEGICEKTEHYNFPRLLDDPKQRHGYYTYLSGDSLELFDQFLSKHHPNPKPEDYVFFKYSDKQKPMDPGTFARRYKTILKRLNFPFEKIWLHEYKELFTTLAKASISREESYRAEFLSGHILPMSQEHYVKRNKIADAQAYLRIDFGASISQKEEEIEALKKQVASSRKQVEKYEEAIEEAGATTKIEIEQLPLAYRTLEEGTPQPTKTEPRPPPKPLSKPLIVKEQPKEIEKPKATSLREKPQSTDQQLNRICLKRLRVFGVGRQIACRNCKKRDPSQYAACLEIQREQLGLS